MSKLSNEDVNKNPDSEKADHDRRRSSVAAFLSQWLPRSLVFITVVVLILIALGLYASGGQFLLYLQKTEISRGFITFLVAVITVSMALILVVWALTSEADETKFKTRFTSAKEILATLVGILGTILGFYFGSSGTETERQLSLSEFKFKGLS